MQNAQRSNARGPCEFEKGKKIDEVTQDAQITETSPCESRKGKKVAEVTRNALRGLCESKKEKKVRGLNICKNVL
ncbi:hypothetical protein HAX54_035606 [Datura stramonium]|uniref:Uncharacterized protein n=1 Tax=Datura stramonium TaxID=4076 RepID=A0ABS8VIA7_DATST|nr:hypothetical protein [Datura stramonium]